MKKVIMLVLMMIGIFLLAYGPSYAKYVSNSVWNYYLKSKGFYFSSDYLNGENNINQFWDGSSTYLNIKNNTNDLLITDYDINYNVECSILGEAASHLECHLNGTSSNTISGILPSLQSCNNEDINVASMDKADCELNGYTWNNLVSVNQIYFDIIPIDSDYTLSDLEVQIKVTSTSPYKKTLVGSFNLHKINNNDDLTIDYQNKSNYNRLIISNKSNSNKCLNISWNSDNLLIDYLNANSEFVSYESDTNNYINSIKLSISSLKSSNYIFYNRNNLVSSINDFIITETTGC